MNGFDETQEMTMLPERLALTGFFLGAVLGAYGSFAGTAAMAAAVAMGLLGVVAVFALRAAGQLDLRALLRNYLDEDRGQ